MPNPRTPVLIGASQILYREQDLQRPIEPIDMMLEAVRCAEQDAQSKLLDQVQSVRVIRGLWRYGHPGRFLAEQIGAPQAQTVGTLFGGNQV